MELRQTLLRLKALLIGPALPADTDAIIERVLHAELPAVVAGHTGVAVSQGVTIWYECIAPAGPPRGTVLLIMAIAGDALIWPPTFVRAFVAAGYQVVRYDHRGTGLSDWLPQWSRQHPYALADMAADAVAVLDALGVGQAHCIGLSMGGMIAQELAIAHPERVTSLTLIMTSGYIGDPALPGLSSGYLLGSLVKGLPLLKYRVRGGEKNLIKERIAKQVLATGAAGVDIQEVAEVVLYDLRNRRGINLKAAVQHQVAVSRSGSRYERLRTLTIPTLVIHGTADRMIPVEHGKHLVSVLPQATGWWLEGVGHVFPVPEMDRLMQTILAHLAAAQGTGAPTRPTDQQASGR